MSLETAISDAQEAGYEMTWNILGSHGGIEEVHTGLLSL